MNALLTGLLEISRCGSAALSFEQLEMNAMISDIVDSMKFSFQQARATIEVEPLPSCRGDKTYVSQVFSNLLDNALKFLDPNRLGIIRISGWQEENRVVFCVEDNGIGMDANSQESIFKLFHRVDPDQRDGLGLGLTLVRRILDRQDGKVWLESVVNEGTKFYVSLPSD
jgi:signal transduction histidine kinase